MSALNAVARSHSLLSHPRVEINSYHCSGRYSAHVPTRRYPFISFKISNVFQQKLYFSPRFYYGTGNGNGPVLECKALNNENQVKDETSLENKCLENRYKILTRNALDIKKTEASEKEAPKEAPVTGIGLTVADFSGYFALETYNRNRPSLSQYLDLAKGFEQKVLNQEGKDAIYNIPAMVTRFRKIYYDSDGWREYLIPDAKTPNIYNFVKKTDEDAIRRLGGKQGDISVKIPLGDIEYTYTPEIWYPSDKESQKVPEIYDAQELRLDGKRWKDLEIDIGHVFAGWDAINYPSHVPPYLGSVRNKDAVTWAGDLGSALAENYFYKLAHGHFSINEAAETILELAPPKDMLGNIHSFAIADRAKMLLSSGQKDQKLTVSEILKDFYITNPPAPTIYVTKIPSSDEIYSSFLRHFREKDLQVADNGLIDKSEWIEFFSGAIGKCAAFYFIVSVKQNTSNWELITKGYSTFFGILSSSDARIYAELFSNALDRSLK